MRDEFAYHQPTEDQLLYMDAVREAYSALATALEEAAVPCRYRSLAMTALEESAMWANKAVVHGHSGNRSDHGVQRFSNPITSGVVVKMDDSDPLRVLPGGV